MREFTEGQHIRILMDGKKHDVGVIQRTGCGGGITDKEVVVACDSIEGQEVVFRHFPAEDVWRYFFRDLDYSLVFSWRGPTYVFQPLDFDTSRTLTLF